MYPVSMKATDSIWSVSMRSDAKTRAIRRPPAISSASRIRIARIPAASFFHDSRRCALRYS